VSGFSGENFHNLAVLQLVAEGHDAPVDLGPDHAVPHLGVDVVGEVYRACAFGQVDDFSLGGKDKNPAP